MGQSVCRDEQLLAELERLNPDGGWGAYRDRIPFVPKLRAMLDGVLARYRIDRVGLERDFTKAQRLLRENDTEGLAALASRSAAKRAVEAAARAREDRDA